MSSVGRRCLILLLKIWLPNAVSKQKWTAPSLQVFNEFLWVIQYINIRFLQCYCFGNRIGRSINLKAYKCNKLFFNEISAFFPHWAGIKLSETLPPIFSTECIISEQIRRNHTHYGAGTHCAGKWKQRRKRNAQTWLSSHFHLSGTQPWIPFLKNRRLVDSAWLHGTYGTCVLVLKCNPIHQSPHKCSCEIQSHLKWNGSHSLLSLPPRLRLLTAFGPYALRLPVDSRCFINCRYSFVNCTDFHTTLHWLWFHAFRFYRKHRKKQTVKWHHKPKQIKSFSIDLF